MPLRERMTAVHPTGVSKYICNEVELEGQAFDQSSIGATQYHESAGQPHQSVAGESLPHHNSVAGPSCSVRPVQHHQLAKILPHHNSRVLSHSVGATQHLQLVAGESLVGVPPHRNSVVGPVRAVQHLQSVAD